MEPFYSTIHPIDAVETILKTFEHFGVDLGLDRIQQLLERLGNPQTRVPVVHVAGSNGKGSTCAYVSSVLNAAGYRVGRYTSPHLISWTERICVNECPIAPEALHTVLLQVQEAIAPDAPSPTQFEVITAAAWLYFAQQEVDIAVMEVGLGGRLDATNVCDRPLVSAITSISREHWQRLGSTLGAIAFEKAGIFKAHCPAVIGVMPPEAETVIQQRIQDLTCPAVWMHPAKDLGNGWAEVSADGEFPLIQYPLPLLGGHQLMNSAVAIAILRQLQVQGWRISPEAIQRGMAAAQWPGRMQWGTWDRYPLLIDGAHNSAGAIALRHYVDTSSRMTPPIHWIMGMLSTKDHAEIFQALLRPGDRLYLVPVDDHSSADPQELSELARRICPDLEDCAFYSDVVLGLQAAKQQANSAPQESSSPLIFCGSLYLIGRILTHPCWQSNP
jgi:dihydrofolate synthase/folylpolyglutamate synthase